MPETQTDPQQQQTNSPPDDEDKAFWDKLTSLVDNRIAHGIDEAVKRYTKSESRNGGNRPSLPKAIARAMGGPFTPVE